MSSRAGLKQIVHCDAGTLATTPVDPLAIGARNAAKLEISELKQVQDYRNRKFRNLQNFHVEAESLQVTMQLIAKIVEWINQGADIQLLTNAPVSGSQDCFQFDDSDYLMGIDFELMLDQDKRSLKVTDEVAMEFDAAKTLIDGADSVTPVTFTGITGEGFDIDKVRVPYFMSFESPAGTSLITSKGEIIKRSFSMKTKTGKKTVYNQSIVDYFSFMLTLQAREASIANIITNLSKGMAGSILWKEQNASSSLYDAFDFNSNVLTLTNKATIDDEERIVELTFEADVPVDEISFLYGDGNGGDVADTDGTTGGTMKIGYNG